MGDTPYLFSFLSGSFIYSLMVVLSGKLTMFTSTKRAIFLPLPFFHAPKQAKIMNAQRSNLFPGVSAFPLFKVEILHGFHPCHEFVDFSSTVSDVSLALCFPRLPTGERVVHTRRHVRREDWEPPNPAATCRGRYNSCSGHRKTVPQHPKLHRSQWQVWDRAGIGS